MSHSSVHQPQGLIAQISLSDGGVPKQSVPNAWVEKTGLRGDRQKNLKYHGGPDRAVCLWSTEIIQALQQEGHPIQPGSTGENITVTGLHWETLTPNVYLQIGDQLQLMITDYAQPCRTIAKFFNQRRYGRISQKQNPGTSRLYAKVITPGPIIVGDIVWIMDSL